jgi:hypothetical protein
MNATRRRRHRDRGRQSIAPRRSFKYGKAAGQQAGDDERGRTGAHADGEKAQGARAHDEGPRQHIVESHAQHRAGHDQLAAPGTVGRRRQARRQRRTNAQHRDRDAGELADGQRLDAQDRADDHGLQRQGRQGQTGARRRRVADGDIVEDEEHPEKQSPSIATPGQSSRRGQRTRSASATGSTQQKPIPQRRIASVSGSASPTR